MQNDIDIVGSTRCHPIATPMPRHFPVELISMILRHLSLFPKKPRVIREWLRETSLISHAWLYPSRTILFRTFSLREDPLDWMDDPRYLQAPRLLFFAMNPHLSSFVSRLFLMEAPPFNISIEDLVRWLPLVFPRVTWLKIATLTANLVVPTVNAWIFTVVFAFPSLHHLDIDMQQSIPAWPHAYPRPSNKSISIHRLNMYTNSMTAHYVISGLAATMSTRTMQSLTLSYDDFQPHEVVQCQRILNEFEALQYLEIQCAHAQLDENIHETIRCANGHPTLSIDRILAC
jgi:hypothetical protein